MRSFLCAAQDRFVRNEPRVATTTEIASSRMCPARDVGFVLIRNPESKPFNFNSPRFREVKDIFVAIVQKTLRINRLKMTVRLEIAFPIFNCDRLDPVNCVLQYKQITQFDCDFIWQHRIGWGGPDVEKK